jgi:hypothetical protein
MLLCLSCGAAQAPTGTVDLAHSHLIDLTYSFDESTLYWPTADGFKWHKDQWGPSPGGYFYASASYGASEHGGTHLDSPLHFAEGHPGTDQIPITDVLAVYAADIAPKHSRPYATTLRLNRLLKYFDGKTLADLNGALCRAYARQSSTDANARRDLEDLRAAINHHRREGLHDRMVSVVLPDRRPSTAARC